MGERFHITLMLGVDAEAPDADGGPSVAERFQKGEFGGPATDPGWIGLALEEATLRRGDLWHPLEVGLAVDYANGEGTGPNRPGERLAVVGIKVAGLDERDSHWISAPISQHQLRHACEAAEQHLKRRGIMTRPELFVLKSFG